MKGILKYILAGLTFIGVVFVLWYFRNIVAYILIAAVVSLIGRPIVHFLLRIKIGSFCLPKWLGAALTLLLMFLILFGFFRLFVPLIINQTQEFSNINFNNISKSLQVPFENLNELYARYVPGDKDPKSFEELLQDKLLSFMDISLISGAIGGTVDILKEMFIAFFSISFISFFFLKNESLFSEGIMMFVPPRYEERFLSFFYSAKNLLTRYFAGILLQVTGITILITLGMMIVGLGFQLSAIIGLVAGIMNVIPYLGPLIGASIGLLLGMSSNLDLDFYHKLLPLLGYMALVFIIVQIIDNVVFQPLIYGTSVKAHPLEIFLVILMAGSLAGIIGMILAIPAYTVLRTFAHEFFYRFKVVQKITEKID